MTLRLHSEMERDLIKIIEDDIEFLQECIARSSSGGWSTHNVSPMQDRVRQLYEKIGRYALRDR